MRTSILFDFEDAIKWNFPMIYFHKMKNQSRISKTKYLSFKTMFEHFLQGGIFLTLSFAELFAT
jgi:hypothetical protein